MKSYNIKGLGYMLAKRRVTNEDLGTSVNANDEWISSKTGIRARYTLEEENTNDLGTRTARMAIDKFDTDSKEADLIIITASTPGQATLSTAHPIQEKLNLNKQHMMAFDLNMAYSGSLYALQNAHAMLVTGQMICALIVDAEVISKQLGWNDRSTCIILADGAGAAIVKQEDTNKRMLHFTGSMGGAAGVTHSDAPKPRPLFSGQPYQPSVVCMEGNATFRSAVKTMQGTIEGMLKQVGGRIEDIDWTIPHQTNARITNNAYKRIHIDKEHAYISMEEYRGTSTASIPLALEEMSEKGLLQPGMKIVLSRFGTGSTWTGCYIEL